MPKLDYHSHGMLVVAGYEYNEKSDKYFSRGPASWEASDKADAGRRQGAFPSSSVAEFRAQEAAWIATQWAKIKELKSVQKSTLAITESAPEEPLMEDVQTDAGEKPKKEKKKKSKETEDDDINMDEDKPKKKKKDDSE